ncbi:hypothetical protein CC79DRAFT_1370885 [Sarocladium strictum]
MSLNHSVIRTIRARPLLNLSTSLSSSRVSHVQLHRSYSSAPATIVDVGFWKSLVPKFLRKENRKELKARRSKEWNPATFFIVIFLCIGSMSIQMITMRNAFERHMRQTEVRIGLLKEVVEKIQKGEDVDVEKMLGTGEPKKEADWEEVLKAIEKDDAARKASKAERAKRAAEAQQAKAELEAAATEAPSTGSTTSKPKTASLGSFF